MTFIERNLLPDERIFFATKKHVIIFFYPVVVFIIAIYAFQYMNANPLLGHVKWIPILIALLIFSSVWLEYATSEFVITNKRILMREGFFYRHSTELRLNTISQVNVGQSMFGQMLDYGTVSLNAFGAADSFNIIAHPMQFQRYANEQMDRVMR